MEVWVEVCRRDLQNLTLFETKLAHFATLFKTTDLFKTLILYTLLKASDPKTHQVKDAK